LENLRPAGESAREAQAMHRRLAAGAGEAHALQARHRLAQELRELGVQLVLVGARRAAVKGGINRPANALVAVAQERRAVAAAQVDVLPAIEVPQSAATAAVEVERMPQRPVDAGRGRDAACEVAAGPFILFDNASQAAPHDISYA